MKDLKFLLVTNTFNEFGVSLRNELNDIGFAKILDTYESNKIINTIIRSDIDVVFLDVDYLGYSDANRIYNLIEKITGKVCICIENCINEEVKNSNNLVSFSKFGSIDYDILKIDLLSLIIDSLNKFNNNKILRNEKCYDFIYIVWDDLRIKKVEIRSIKEIIKKEKSIYMFCNEKYAEKRVINMSFEMLYKLLNKNFEKSRFKITNKDWLKKTSKNNSFFLRKSA